MTPQAIYTITPPPLVDELVKDTNLLSTDTEINGQWYIAKPMPYYHWKNTIRKIYHAYLILRGKAMAVQFAEDRK
jgi:hypothetical protein